MVPDELLDEELEEELELLELEEALELVLELAALDEDALLELDEDVDVEDEPSPPTLPPHPAKAAAITSTQKNKPMRRDTRPVPINLFMTVPRLKTLSMAPGTDQCVVNPSEQAVICHKSNN